MSEPLNKKQLYDLVWKKPMMEVAKEYGLSDRGLAKLCERNGIPVPPRGWWARKHAGYKVTKPPLITLEPKEPDTVILMKRAAFQESVDEEKSDASKLPAEIQQAMDRESLPKNRVKVPKTLSDPHPIVDAWIKDEERRWENARKYDGYWGSLEKPNALERRRRRIISAFLKALETRGFKVDPEKEWAHFIWVIYERDKICFSIDERMRHIRRELTKEELKDRPHSKQKWTQTAQPTGKFVLRLSLETRRNYDLKNFQDSDDCPLEAQLNNVIAAIIEQLWRAKMHRMARDEAERQRWREQDARRRAEELLKAEQKRKAELEAKVSDWKKAQHIREYISAVDDACRNNQLTVDPDTLARWTQWALTHADNLDCIASKNPLIALSAESEAEEEDVEA